MMQKRDAVLAEREACTDSFCKTLTEQGHWLLGYKTPSNVDSARMQEVLRMYPPVAIGQVRVNWAQDITLACRLHLPAGTAVWVPHHGIQNASFNWDQPESFLPGGGPAVIAVTSLHVHAPASACSAVRPISAAGL
jgi:cytochrome P450